MYNNFFGFRERPFKLVPDPAYLFLSKSHEEAMAHLIYAISQGEGFVEIIGEAGTGKTTLCRALLEKVEEETEVAYIFNPKLDSLQLLKAINDEFGIDSKANNIKDLIDILNAFLIEKKAERKKAILLIDEAQNLTKEVLEQLRLLSNLETTTDKLLQIILVGQPELGDMLDSHELRQLGQRITLSCYLKPLTPKETKAYIRHRIDIASQRPGVKFSRSAIRSIYRYSRGIPRLVNIASNRSLLVAFGLNRKEICGRVAGSAIRELAGRSDIRRYGSQPESRPALMFSLLLSVLFIFILYHFDLFDITALSKAGRVEKSKPFGKAPHEIEKAPLSSVQAKKGKEVLRPNITKPDSVLKSPESFESFLRRLDARSSREGALKAALKLWGNAVLIQQHLKNMETDKDFFRLVAKQNGFSELSIQNDLELVKTLDLPTILECYAPGNPDPTYVTIKGIDGNKLTLKSGIEDASIEAEISELKSYCSGSGYIFWKNHLGIVDDSPFRLSMDSVIILKMVLYDIGFNNIQLSPFYDSQTKEAIKQIQEKHGIKADGIVGPLTKIVLYNEIKSSEIPHIRKR
ncbi:ExeA family protein [Thermodesulfobacteriota bacterium]